MATTYSQALTGWRGTRSAHLDELEQVHGLVTQHRPGRQWLTGQINAAYIIAIAAQFQGFCRDLHTEGGIFVAAQAPRGVRHIVANVLTSGRYLDRGNANPQNLTDDFNRFNFSLWSEVFAVNNNHQARQLALEQLVIWRNSLAHSAPVSAGNASKIAGTKPTLFYARRWRVAVDVLATAFDKVMRRQLRISAGSWPW